MAASTHPAYGTSGPASAMSGVTYRTIDEFHHARGDDWVELKALLAQVGPRGLARLGPDATARFAELYRAVSADLAISRLRFGRSPVTTELNRLVAHAHAVLYAEPSGVTRRAIAFLRTGFPQAVRRNRRSIAATIALLVLSVAAGWFWYAVAPIEARGAFGVSEQFNKAETPLIADAADGFADFLLIAVNNILVTLSAFALGATVVGAGVAIIYNGMLLGIITGISLRQDRLGDLLALIVPHGIVELSIICIAVAGGLRIGFTMLNPGRRRWSLAVKAASEEGLKLLLGTMPLFVAAALVEGFVTPLGLPVVVNVTIGIVFGAVMWGYLFVAGRPRMPRAAGTGVAAGVPAGSAGPAAG